jgi:hypothetical protein
MERLLNPVIWVLVLASVFPLWAAMQVDPSMLGDDALITLTYAKNLARGDGFVFNHPPPVLGTTTPLYAIVVAAAGAGIRSVDLTKLALCVSALCWVGVVWSCYCFRREFFLTEWHAAIVGVVMAVTGWVRHLEMEAYLFALLLMIATGLFFRGRLFAAGFVSALLLLTRGEGALLFGILFMLAVVAERRESRSHLEKDRSRSGVLSLSIGFAIPVLAWSLYAQVTFGGVLPNTLAAKVAQGASGLWRPFLEQLLGVWMPGWGRGLALPGIPVFGLWYLLVAIGLVVVLLRHRPLLVPVAWMVAYVVGYSLLGVAGYPWYALPVYFVVSLLLGIGVGSAATTVARLFRRVRWGTTAAGVAVAAVVLWLAVPTVRAALTPRTSQRHVAYSELARWLRDHTEPSESVAYHEIGYLGYHTDNRIVDLVGLVSPDITPHVAIGDFAWGFWASQPDYLVHLEGSKFFAGIVGDPRFARMYRPVARVAGDHDLPLTVYRKVNAR